MNAEGEREPAIHQIVDPHMTACGLSLIKDGHLNIFHGDRDRDNVTCKNCLRSKRYRV